MPSRLRLASQADMTYSGRPSISRPAFGVITLPNFEAMT